MKKSTHHSIIKIAQNIPTPKVIKAPRVSKAILAKQNSLLKDAATKLMGMLRNRVLVARYDSLKPDPLRQPPEYRTDPTETEQQFAAWERILAYLQCNELYDNSPVGQTVDTAIRLTIGKKGGTPLFSGENSDALQAAFDNWRWHCGYEENDSLQDVLGRILHCVVVHGDCLVLCDNLTDYKIRIFDADQICNCLDFDGMKEELGLPEDARQVEGVVTDNSGRVLGYFVTMLRNRYGVGREDATFLPATICKRVSFRKKHSQYRGEPLIINNQQLSEYTKELLKSELGAAKLAAELALVIEQPAGQSVNEQLAAILEGFSGDENGGDLAQEAGLGTEDLATLTEATKPPQTFEAFEGKSSVASVPAGTHVTNLQNSNRPSQPIQSWVDVLADANGRCLGLMSSLSRGRCENNYSSGEIEISVSWKSIEQFQQLLERQVIDYVIEQMFGTECDYECYWDQAFAIDPEKREKTLDAQLHGGRTTYREILGPDWRAHLRELAEEKAFIEEIGLTNLSFYETAAGAPIDAGQNDNPDEDLNDDGNA